MILKILKKNFSFNDGGEGGGGDEGGGLESFEWLGRGVGGDFETNTVQLHRRIALPTCFIGELLYRRSALPTKCFTDERLYRPAYQGFEALRMSIFAPSND